MTAALDTMRGVLEHNADVYRKSPALRQGEVELSHEALLRRASSIANALLGLGARRRDRIATLMPNGIEIACVLSATDVCGMTAVPLNWRLSTREIIEIARDCAPRVLVYDPAFTDLAAHIATSVESLDHLVVAGPAGSGPGFGLPELVAAASDEPPASHPRADDLSAISYTSGTSGRAKGVMLGHRGQVEGARMVANVMRVTTEDRALVSMPYFHVGARVCQNGFNFAGAGVTLMEKFDPHTAVELIESQSITLMPLVPTMLDALLRAAGHHSASLGSIRTVLYTGERMSLELLRRAINFFGPKLLGMYGQTENIGCAILYPEEHVLRDERDARILSSVGRPHPMARVAVVGPDDKPVAPGTAGEILLQSPVVMLGYWNNSVATVETLRDGWIRSGDIGSFSADGYLSIVGRRKDMIITGGENVYAAEVEEALLRHSAIREAAVIGVPDATWGEAVKAFVVPEDGVVLTAEDVEAHVRTQIAGYKRPRHIEFRNELPKNGVGKIDKRRLGSTIGLLEEARTVQPLSS